MIIKPFISIYVSEEFYSAWEYAPPLIVGAAFLSFATLLAMPYIVNKDSKGFLYSSTIGAVFNAILNFLLIPYFGALGAAVATCISYFVVLVYRYHNIKKYLVIEAFSFKHSISYLMLLTAGGVVYISSMLKYVIFVVILLLAIFIHLDNIKAIIIMIIRRFKKQ